MRKTDFEIAADAIKFCRSELMRYESLLTRVALGEINPNENVVKVWRCNAEKIEKILGEREEE